MCKVKRVGKHSVPLGRLYMDAYGDPGRSKGSLPLYAVCTVWVPYTEQELHRLFGEVRQALKLHATYEFHAKHLSSKDGNMSERFFEELLKRDVEMDVWCAEVEKSSSRLPTTVAGTKLTCELMAQILARMPSGRAVGQTLVIDDKRAFKIVNALRSGIKSALADRGCSYPLGKLTTRPAHEYDGLQLADFVAAALVTPWPHFNKCQKKAAQKGLWKVQHWRS